MAMLKTVAIASAALRRRMTSLHSSPCSFLAVSNSVLVVSHSPYRSFVHHHSFPFSNFPRHYARMAHRIWPPVRPTPGGSYESEPEDELVESRDEWDVDPDKESDDGEESEEEWEGFMLDLKDLGNKDDNPNEESTKEEGSS